MYQVSVVNRSSLPGWALYPTTSSRPPQLGAHPFGVMSGAFVADLPSESMRALRTERYVLLIWNAWSGPQYHMTLLNAWFSGPRARPSRTFARHGVVVEIGPLLRLMRSEERRVGREWRCRWSR